MLLRFPLAAKAREWHWHSACVDPLFFTTHILNTHQNQSTQALSGGNTDINICWRAEIELTAGVEARSTEIAFWMKPEYQTHFPRQQTNLIHNDGKKQTNK